MPQSNKVNLKVQELSGFDKSFYHDLTANVGTLVPALFDEVIANSTINLNVAASVSLPPLASDTFMKCDLKLEAFACPLRILYGGFERFFIDLEGRYYDPEFDVTSVSSFVPCVSIGSNWDHVPQVFDRGSLSDYLGLKLASSHYMGAKFSILPYLCYHKVYDDWYRQPLVQEQLFSDGILDGASGSSEPCVANLPYLTFGGSQSFLYAYDDDNLWMNFCNGDSLFTLHQRNYGFDYFTNAWPHLQAGVAQSVEVDSDGQFSIAQLRVANSFQQFSERSNFAPRYYEAIRARYGNSVSHAVVQRPVFLGSAIIPVKSYGVDVQGINIAADPASPTQRNPFADSAGAQLGRARGEGFVNLIDNFHVEEPSYIMVLASLVPRAVYSSGVSRVFDRYFRAGGITDMANPLLQNVGNQPIWEWELNGRLSLDHGYSFGYTDRYADWMTCPDRVSGELREDGSLEAFVLKRDFEGQNVSLGSRFLQIPTTALNEVSATTETLSGYGAWMQFGFDYKVVQPLALYSMPSLQDPAYEHGKNIEVYRGGFHF